MSKRWVYIPLAMAVSMVALALARLSYGLLLPFMRDDLSLSFQQAGNLGTATSLGYLLLVLPAGYLTRHYGPRSIILCGLGLTVVGFAGLSATYGYSVLLLWMVILGIGTALTYTPVITYIVGWFPERRGLVLGLVNSGIGLGVFICGLVIPLIAANESGHGWRVVWGLFAVVAFLVGVTGFFLFRNPDATPRGSVADAVLAGSVYRSRLVRLAGACYFIIGFSYIVQTVFMYSFALSSGIDEKSAGAMASMGGLLSLFSGLIWGTLSDYTGRPATLFLCFSGAAVATFTPVVFPTESGFLVHYLLSGLTVSGLFATIVAATSEYVKSSQVPIAIGFVTTLFAIGQLIGPAVGGWVIDVSGTFSTAFIISGSSMLIGALTALFLHYRQRLLNG